MIAFMRTWNQRATRIGLMLLLGTFLCGCRLIVPMYVWSPAKTSHSPKYAVAIGHLEGNIKTTADFYNAFRNQRPLTQDHIAAFTPEDLIDPAEVQLASTAPPTLKHGELGAMQQARKLGTDFLLMGEVLRDELEINKPASNLPSEVQAVIDAQTSAAPITARRPEHLTIAWRAVNTVTGETVASFTTIMDRNQADQKYPELVWEHPEPRKRVIEATARETWKSIGPHVTKDRANLAVSWAWPGSDKIRKGVVLAKNSRWMEAEQEWLEVVQKYPGHHRAWHNLALAAAAREDFSTAKNHIRRALELSDRRHYQNTFHWIELRQREYHIAFDLPTPVEGWAFPEPLRTSSVQVDQVRPIDLDAEPWYRVLPGVKPPEWSWYAWLTQPIPF